MTDPSDKDPVFDEATSERDTTSLDYLRGLKRAQTISAEQFGRLVVADPEGEEVRDFMQANGLEFGEDVVVTIENGRTVVMSTDRDDFGTTDRTASDALTELSEKAPEAVETHSEKAQHGQEELGELVVESTVAVNGEAVSVESATISRLEAEKDSTESHSENDQNAEEAARKEKAILRQELDGLVGTILDLRAMNPHDTEGYAVQAAIRDRMKYYGVLKDRGDLGSEAHETLIAMSIGAAKDIEYARSTLTGLKDEGKLDETQAKIMMDYSSRIDQTVRSQRQPDQVTIMATISDIERNARDAGQDTAFGRSLLAMAAGLATHLNDPGQIRSVTSNVWGSRI